MKLQINADQVREQFERIARTAVLPARRDRELLRFLMEESLTQPHARVTAAKVARHLFTAERPDAEQEHYARTLAGRIRNALAVYYQNEGSQDPVKFVIPKGGGYAPKFVLNLSPTSVHGAEDYVTTPPLPTFYIRRSEPLDYLRETVLAENPGQQIAVTAIHGMGGIGKTVLAQALCRDERVREQFRDGIIWVSVGKETQINIIEQMREIGKAFYDDLDSYDTRQGCINRYRTKIRNKAALLVLDDVWRVEDVAPFIADAPRSRLLFTTRDSTFAGSLGAYDYAAKKLEPKQSLELLSRWAGNSAKDLPDEAQEVINECGGLPLAVAMIGAMLRGRPSTYWKYVLSLLRHADLRTIRADFPGYVYSDLYRAIQVSIDALDPKQQTRYLALAVLPEDISIHPVIQQQLWNAQELDALASAESLIGLSLAERDGEGIRLHDLQSDYIRAQYPDNQALNIILEAARLSSHIIRRDPSQFAAQMIARLLQNENSPAISKLIASLSTMRPRPWLRPLEATLSLPHGALVRTVDLHTSHVSGIALHPDQRRALSSSWDHTLKVWDVDTGMEIRTLKGHVDRVLDVSSDPRAQRLNSAIKDQTRSDRIRRMFAFELHHMIHRSGSVSALALHPDGRRVISASWDMTLKIWDIETGEEIRTLEGHSDTVRDVVITPDGSRIVSASWDHTLKVWDVDTGMEIRTLKGHVDRVLALVYYPAEAWVVSASSDRTIKVWDIETGEEIRTLEGHSDPVTTLALHPKKPWILSGSADHTIKIWDVQSGVELSTPRTYLSSVEVLHVHRDGVRVISGCWDNSLEVWDIHTGKELDRLDGHSGRVNAIATSNDGNLLISASQDNTIKIWNILSSRATHIIKNHSLGILGLTVSSDGSTAASASRDHTVKIWDVQSRKEVRVLPHSEMVVSATFHADGRRLISGCWDHSIKVWDLGTGEDINTLIGHQSAISDVVIHPDGRRALSGSQDGLIKEWELETGQELRTLKGHRFAVYTIVVSPDGRRAVSASMDHTIKIWDLETGQELQTLRGHAGEVTDIELLSDARFVISTSEDKNIRLWDIATGETIASFCCDAPVLCTTVAINDIILAGDARGQLHWLHLEQHDPHTSACG